MSSQELDRLLEDLGLDSGDLKNDASDLLDEFTASLNETLEDPNWSGSEHWPDDSAGEESALSGDTVKPRTFPKAPGTMVKSPVGRGATLAAKRGKDDATFTRRMGMKRSVRDAPTSALIPVTRSTSASTRPPITKSSRSINEL
jgi:hypothetical protein